MSRTRRRLPSPHRGFWFRKPSRNNSHQEGVRKGAVPPVEFDDIPVQDDVLKVYNLLDNLLNEGYELEDIAHILTKKYKVSYPEAYEHVRKRNERI